MLRKAFLLVALFCWGSTLQAQNVQSGPPGVMVFGPGSSGGGVATSIVVGTTTLTGGANTLVLFDNAGVVGEDVNLAYTVASGLLTVQRLTASTSITPGQILSPGGAAGAILLGTTGNVQFGGATSAFPSLIRNGVILNVNLADNSNNTSLKVGPGNNGANAALIIGALGGLDGDGAGGLGSTNITDTAFIPFSALWLRQRSDGALNADYTNATTTFSSTNLSVTLVSGRTYSFDLSIYVTESTAVDGWKIDFNGGSATITNFVANCFSTNETGGSVALGAATTAALATVINATTTVTTGVQLIECHGTVVPSSSSTFIVRGAQNAHSTGTVTFKRGSSLSMRDTPAL